MGLRSLLWGKLYLHLYRQISFPFRRFLFFGGWGRVFVEDTVYIPGDIGGACSTYRGVEFPTGFRRGNVREGDHVEDVDIDRGG